MNARTNPRAALIAAAIDKSATCIDRQSATTWSAVFHNGTALAVQVALENEWLRLDATLAPPVPDLWSVLQRNATLPAGLKFVVGDAGDPPVFLRAEIALEDEVDPTGRVLDACTALKTVAHVWDAADRLEGSRDGHVLTSSDIATLCNETGWPVAARDGSAHVELDVPGDFVHARVEATHDGGIIATVPLGVDRSVAPTSAAAALLLLRTTGAVRLVRAAADASARFEVAMRASVSAAGLTQALAALSIASRVAGREAAVLARDESIAHAYLRQSPASLAASAPHSLRNHNGAQP